MNKIIQTFSKVIYSKVFFTAIKILAIWYTIYLVTFTKIFEDNTRIYWCFGSFSLDDNIELIIVTFCSASVPISFFLILIFYIGLKK